MTLYQALLVITLVCICFFVSETFQLVLKTEHRSQKRWNWSFGLLILDTVLVKVFDGEWWPLALLPSAVRELSILILCVGVFFVFAWVLIMSGDLIKRLFKGR